MGINDSKGVYIGVKQLKSIMKKINENCEGIDDDVAYTKLLQTKVSTNIYINPSLNGAHFLVGSGDNYSYNHDLPRIQNFLVTNSHPRMQIPNSGTIIMPKNEYRQMKLMYDGNDNNNDYNDHDDYNKRYCCDFTKNIIF